MDAPQSLLERHGFIFQASIKNISLTITTSCVLFAIQTQFMKKMSVKVLAETHENCYNIIPPHADEPLHLQSARCYIKYGVSSWLIERKNNNHSEV